MAKGRGAAGGGRTDRITGGTIIAVSLFFFMVVLLYRVIGKAGMAILSFPFSAVFLLYLLSETMWERSVFRGTKFLLRGDREREAGKLRRRMTLFGAAIGVSLSVLLVILQPVIYGSYTPYIGSRWGLLAILPALVVIGASGGMKGYLRAQHTGTGIFLAGVLRSFLQLLLPCIFGAILKSRGARVDALLRTQIYTSVYGAVGAMIGFSLAWLIAGVLYLLMVLRFRKTILFSAKGDRGRDYAFVTKEGALPLLLFLLLMFSMWRFFHIAPAGEETELEHMSGWGQYIGSALAPTLLIGCLSSLPFVLRIYQMYARFHRDDVTSALDRFAGMVRHGMILMLPVSAFVCALAQPLITVLFGRPDETATAVLRLQIPAAPLVGFSILITILFLKFGGFIMVMIGAGAGTGLFITLMLAFTAGKERLTGYALGCDLGLLLYLVIISISLASSLSYRQEWIHGLLIPLLCATLSALPVFLSASPLSGLVGELVAVLLLSALGGVLYLVLLALLHGLAEYELYRLPGGGILVIVSRLIFGRGS